MLDFIFRPSRALVARADMDGSGRYPCHQPPTQTSGWRPGGPPASEEDDYRARPIRLENHAEATFEGRRIALIPVDELILMLPRVLAQREDMRVQADQCRARLERLRHEAWVPHDTYECSMRRRADMFEFLIRRTEQEARLSQAASHMYQRLLVLNPLAVLNGPYP